MKMKKVISLKLAFVLFSISFIIIYYLLREQPEDLLIQSDTSGNVNYLLPKDIMHLDLVENVHEAFNGEKIVHLDLKGAPPKMSYYGKLFPLLAKLGATGILIEYEDMFPYNGPYLSNVSALNAYTVKDIQLINQLAKNHKLKVIPLVQTFGHMEFILKLQAYKHYREAPSYPRAICPSAENTLNLLMDMIEQIVNTHEKIEMIHIGSDEVYEIGMCDKCTKKMFEHNFTKNLLFLDHFNSVITMINRKYPHLRILFWDDHLRSIAKSAMTSSLSGTNFEPVVWYYKKDAYDELGPTLWEKYSRIVPKAWVASAFKGATGSDNIVCDVSHYVQNHRSWMSIMSEYKNRIDFEGIIITGWQRYDHFSILCELLPVGLPSLAMSLRVLQGFQDSPLSPPTAVAKLLQCDRPFALIGSAFGSPKCKFPGGAILENVMRLQQLKSEYDILMEKSTVKGWLTDYNIQNSFSNTRHVETIMDSLDKIRGELEQVDNDMVIAMQEVYDNYTISEWRDTHVKPFKNKVVSLSDAKDRLLTQDVWPKRPVVVDNEL